MNAAGIGAECDAAIVMGGDGTMLGIARQLAPFNVPLIGINRGRLGFMTDIPLEGMHDALARILSGSYKAERRTLLEGRVCAAATPSTSAWRSTTWWWRAAPAPAWPNCASTWTASSCTTSAPMA
jgi:NAD kinase